MLQQNGGTHNQGGSMKEWAISYFKHRDLFERKIAKIEEESGMLVINNKDGTKKQCVVQQEVSCVDADIIVTANTKQNLDYLLAHWDKFVAKEGQKIIFANPKTNEKWIIVPSNHARVAEKESLRAGLETMFSEVTEVE